MGIKNKKFKLEVITNNKKDDIVGYVVNGKEYKRGSEDLKTFFFKVAKDQGDRYYEFLDFCFPKDRKATHQSLTETEYKQIKNKKPAKKSLKTKIAAVGTAAVMAITGLAYAYGVPLARAIKDDKDAYAGTKTEQNIEKEENKKLKSIYDKLLKTENGKTLVKQLQETDKWQSNYNTKMANYPDANGDVLFLKAREVSAVQDISNAENTKFISLDYDETRFCDYLEAASITTPGLYVSEESTGEHKLIHDKDTKNEMKNEEDFALSAIKGNKSDSEIDNHFKELMETGLTYTAAGVNTAYLGEGSNIVIANNGSHSPELDEFIKKVKTNNDGANKLDTYAKSKTDLTNEQRKLVDEAWKEMDKQNIKTDLKSRDQFDMATTEKGKRIYGAMVSGGYLIGGSGGTYTYVTSSGKTIKVSKSEAEKRFGKDAVKEAEKKADNNVKVDTDGDGKTDMGMNDANKEQEKKKEELENAADNYEKDYAQGRSDGYAGRAKAKSTPGYNAGYANGVKQKEEEKEPDEIIKEEEEIEYNQESPTEEKKQVETNTEPTTTRQTVTEIKPYVEEVKSYQTETTETINIEYNDGTAYKTSFQRVRA